MPFINKKESKIMKQKIAIILVLTLLAGLCAFASAEEQENQSTVAVVATVVLVVDGSGDGAVTGEMSTGLANPLHESSVAGILEKVGVSLPAPDFANSASWFVINGNPVIGELRFAVGEQNYCYRVAQAVSYSDISGMYYTWTNSGSASVDYNNATVCFIPGEQGIIQWYDVVPGVMYSLSVDSGADAAGLTEMANKIFKPLQGDVGGDTTEITGTVYGTVVYASNSEVCVNAYDGVYTFRITSRTNVQTAYFDTGDYLCIQYSGDLNNGPLAVVISKVEIVEPTWEPQPTWQPQPTAEPWINPVQNPMISGSGSLVYWDGYSCTLYTDGGETVNLGIASNIDIPDGYFPSSGDYVGYTYNSVLCELAAIYCISAASREPDIVWEDIVPESEPVVEEHATGLLF